MARSIPTAPTRRKLDIAIEACWLAAAGLVPLAIAPESWMVGFVQVPKVFILRTVAILLAALMAWETADRYATWPGRVQPLGDQAKVIAKGLVDSLFERPIVAAGLGVLLITAISAFFSPMPNVSIWGRDPGWDGYYLFSIASHIMVFLAIATHMRTEAQVMRLFWVITAAAVILSIYGLGQVLGIDGFRNDSDTFRASLTFGNPTFGAAYLITAIPLTIALWQSRQWRFGLPVRLLIGVGLIAPAVLGVFATASRGAAVALVVAAAVFLALAMWFRGTRTKVKAGAGVLGLAGAFIALLLFIPAWSSHTSLIRERLATIPSEVSAVFNETTERRLIWNNAIDAYANPTWVDTQTFPEMPEAGSVLTRYVFGFGPDMFLHVHNLQELTHTRYLPSDNAHNFVLHTLVEMGAIGVLAYGALAAAVGYALWRLVRSAKRGTLSITRAWLVAGLASAAVARLIEQMIGKSQVADMSIMWILAGVVAAMTATAFHIHPSSDESVNVPASRASAARRTKQRYESKRWPAKTGPYLASGALTLLAIVFWAQAVWPHMNAAMIAGRGVALGEEGQAAQAAVLLRRAAERTPDSATIAGLLSDGLRAQATSRSDATDDDRVRLLRRSQQVIAAPVARNPMDHRVGSIHTRVLIALAQLEPGSWQPAIRAAAAEVELRPHHTTLVVNLAKVFAWSGDSRSSYRVLEAAERMEPDATQRREILLIREWMEDHL